MVEILEEEDDEDGNEDGEDEEEYQEQDEDCQKKTKIVDEEIVETPPKINVVPPQIPPSGA